MATLQGTSMRTGIRHRARYVIGIPLTAAAVTALVVIGGVLGRDDTPNRVTTVSAPAAVTADQAIANHDLMEATKGMTTTTTSAAAARSAVIQRAMDDGAMWRELTGERTATTVPDMAATDGIFPIPATTTTLPDMAATDGIFPVPVTTTSPFAGQGLDPALYETAPFAGQGLDPALYETALFDGAIFESLVEQMLRGDAEPFVGFPEAASITLDPAIQVMIDQHQAGLEPQLLLER